MMAKTKTLTLTVHRAIVSDDFPWTLSNLLDRLKMDMNPGDHIIERDLLSKTAINFPLFPKTNKAIAAQFALYEEGAEKSTIQPEGNAESYSTASLTAPTAEEFLDREVAILVDGNYLIACGLRSRHGLLIDAIGKLANRCNIKMHPSALHLTNTPNHLTIDKIRSVGVKSVKFDAANLLGSFDIPTDSLIGEIFGGMTSAKKLQQQDMVAELCIHPKISRKMKVDTVATLKNEWLERTAVKAFQEEGVSSYTIVLDDETEWKEGELKLSRKVTVDADGSTYNMPQALQKMLEYYDYLQDGGHLK